MQRSSKRTERKQRTRAGKSSPQYQSHAAENLSPRFLWRLPSAMGNQAVSELFDNGGEKRSRPTNSDSKSITSTENKLTIGSPADASEREADHNAGQVTQILPGKVCGPRTPDRIFPDMRWANGLEQSQGMQIGTTSSGQPGSSEVPSSVLDVLRSPGQPLDPATRAFMEPRFGYDFGSVRLHSDPAASKSAADVQARAYTVGQHVVLREPASPQLLAHELTHVIQQGSNKKPLLQREPEGKRASPPTQNPGLETRLKVIDETGQAAHSRLNEIIRTGGPMPEGDKAKVIGAAIIDVEGYQGPKEMRAISGADTDGLGKGAAVYHASSPGDRTLSATRTIAGSGPRRDFPFSHINDAEMKLFEDILARLPKDAKGTIYFTTMRFRRENGQVVLEPYPACSGCIRASFEAAGSMQKVDLVSAAPVHPSPKTDLTKPQGGQAQHEDPPVTNPQGLKPGKVNMSPRDADVDPATGRVVPGPNTDAARMRRAQATAAKPAAGSDQEGSIGVSGGTPPAKTAGTPQSGRYTGMAIGITAGVASVGLAWLAAWLKAKVDQKIAQKQIDAFLALAKKKINEKPDDALMKMMRDPYTTVYAWVHLNSAVITTFGVDNSSSEPVMSDSSPMFDLGQIDYATAPVPKELANSLPQITGGGRHITTVRTIIIDIPLSTPPLEDLISYAKSRNLPLLDLRAYVLDRYRAALTTYQTTLDTQQKAQEAFRIENEVYQKIKAQFEIAKKSNDTELQKLLAEKLLSVANSMTSTTGLLKPNREAIEDADEKVRYWKHILDLTK